MLAIAADATVGDCQNCSVLYQSLNEYVSSFVALKQKIAVSDDSIRLQQQLEELQIRLVTLEKKTADYESVQAELEENKVALKAYEQMSEQMEQLKQENSKTMAEKNKLEDQMKEANEVTETQALENAQLKREMAVIENELLKVQTSLKISQAQADQVEKLIEENTKTTSIKDSLENKVGLLEDSIRKQNHQIFQLTKEKNLLEGNVYDLQKRLLKLERERSKEYRSTSTQASVPEEPKVDKEKFRMLLENLWACVEPQPQPSANLLHLPGDKHGSYGDRLMEDRKTILNPPMTLFPFNKRSPYSSQHQCQTTVLESSALPTEEDVDLPVVTTEEVENISKDLGPNELSGVTEMKGKISTDGEEVHLKKEMQTVCLVSAASSSISDCSSGVIK
ncbi:Little elongation complex subunit 1 [Larimichthys crocea]|uniref:Uncharacterized protein n=1 Tax=Larimichthys crocea TaxID=215358 RepID=A0ACD3QWV5_LARCR|nr:Little elongation complex subunit 1 [Larimichthys crocea]